jgi:hypothetical protein
MFRSLLRSAHVLLVIPSVLVTACASTPQVVAPTSQGWRPAPSSEVAEHCSADAQACYREGMEALSGSNPQIFQAQNLLAAACNAEVKRACQVLDERFRAPAAIRVPALSGAPPSGTAVVEFTCRLSSEGTLETCDRTRSTNANPSLDQSMSQQMASRQALARFHPATLDGQPYATEVRLMYLMRSESLAGPNVFAGTVTPPTPRGITGGGGGFSCPTRCAR